MEAEGGSLGHSPPESSGDDPPFDVEDQSSPAAKGISAPAILLHREDYDAARDRQFQLIVARCAVIRNLVEKVDQYRELSNDEVLILTHTLGNLDHGPDALNSLFRRCPAVDEHHYLKSRLRGNPMSCGKIRSRVPELTARIGCNCGFDPRVSSYPHPLLHLQVSDDSTLGITIGSLQFHSLMQDYLRTKKIIRETEAVMEKYQERLMTLFQEAGIEEADTPYGKLKKTGGENNAVSFTLEV
jgi:hypothetical protein